MLYDFFIVGCNAKPRLEKLVGSRALDILFNLHSCIVSFVGCRGVAVVSITNVFPVVKMRLVSYSSAGLLVVKLYQSYQDIVVVLELA